MRWTHGRRSACALAWAAMILTATPAVPDGQRPAPPDPAETERAEEPALVEKVEVTATRLPDEARRLREVPAHVTVISRDEIDRSGARTLADLLTVEAGVVVYDQVGNDIEKTVDLRGFTGGSGTKVFVDGAPLNDVRNNGLVLHLVPLESLERIEITRGPAAAMSGGGSEAGTIHLRTRRSRALDGRVSLEVGTFDTARYAGEFGGARGRTDFFVSGSWEDVGGFRQNAAGELRRLAGNVGVELDGDRRLDLSVLGAASELGNPGALTPDEVAQDPRLSPFNSLDRSDETLRIASVNFRGPLARPLSIAANLFLRRRGSESLTTGRSAASFGGFFFDSSASSVGSAVQVSHRVGSDDRGNELTVGLEWLGGRTDALGFFTPPEDPGTVGPENLASDNTSRRRTVALFVQDHWRPAKRWTLTAGARLDRDRVRYDEALPLPLNDASRRFSEISFRLGATWAPSPGYGFWASYGEAFLPPTVEQLFAFPTFGSNQDLRPEDSRSYEVGFRAAWKRGLRLDLALFEADTVDEIVFDFASLENVNAGETRRQGVEASLRGRPATNLEIFANATVVDAEFRNGPHRGNRVPLVPRERFAAGVHVKLPARVALRADAVHVGEQVMDSDPANEGPRSASYTVFNARVSWEPETRWRAARAREHRGIRLFVEARNLFDRDYATRGIAPFPGAVFLTPAPGRLYSLGAEWSF